MFSSTYLHFSSDTFDLRLLESHSLSDSERRRGVVAVEWQRSLRDLLVAEHKVHLHSSLLRLQGQKSLPHQRITFEESRKCVGVKRNLTGDWRCRELNRAVVGSRSNEALSWWCLRCRVDDLITHIAVSVFRLMGSNLLLLAMFALKMRQGCRQQWSRLRVNSCRWNRSSVSTVCRWWFRCWQWFHAFAVIEIWLGYSWREVERRNHWRICGRKISFKSRLKKDKRNKKFL